MYARFARRPFLYVLGVLFGFGGCAETGQSVGNATDWGETCTTDAGDFVDCGATACGWSCSDEGCEATCSDELDETVTFALEGSAVSLSIESAEADCHLAEVDHGRSKSLSVEYDDGEGNSLSLWVMDVDGFGDYNTPDDGVVGSVLATYKSADGLEIHSTLCSVTLSTTEGGGIAGDNFACGLYEGSASEFLAELTASFSCSPQALWYYR